MRIGITFDLKETAARDGRPDDFQEEFDSPATIEAIAAALRRLGHEVVKLGDGRGLIERLLRRPPELVFNIAEGQGVSRAREARVPALLEMLDVPYTGSDPLTLAATLDKDCAKKLVAAAGVAVPASILLQPEDDPRRKLLDAGLPFPVILKPAWEGSSKGIRGKCLVDTPGEAAEVVEELRRAYQQPILAEEYVEGRELTVGVLGNDPPRILGVMEVVPLGAAGRFVYSLEVKRDYLRQVRYECPARLGPAGAAVAEAALLAYEALGCRDVARVDFRLKGRTPYFLEVNPLPGLNPESSDLVIMAGAVGVGYDELIGEILQAALARQDRPATSATIPTF
jgi:D-alanine-D-alanine ligase